MKEENRLYQIWCTYLPLFAQGLMDFISFDDYKRQVLKPIQKQSGNAITIFQSNSKTDEEILADVDSILNMKFTEDSSF